MNAIAAAGIWFSDVNQVLEEDGLARFARSLSAVLAVIHEKREALGASAVVTNTPIGSTR
jgi:hypothetical protein